MKIMNKSLLVFFSLILVSTFSTQTFSADEAEASGVEEIVVTARKRAESIQDVPVAVSALSAGQLERGSVQTVLDVAKLVPNVELHEITQAGAALGASIRGMTFDDLEKTYEPTVGISIDGVLNDLFS